MSLLNINGKNYRIAEIEQHKFGLFGQAAIISDGEIVYLNDHMGQRWLITVYETRILAPNIYIRAENGSEVKVHPDGTMGPKSSWFPYHSFSEKNCSFPTEFELRTYLNLTYGI